MERTKLIDERENQRRAIYDLATERTAPPSDIYVQFWLNVIKSGVVTKDIEYIQSHTFEIHYGLISDKYFAWFLGLRKDGVSLELVRELLLRRVKNG